MSFESLHHSCAVICNLDDAIVILIVPNGHRDLFLVQVDEKRERSWVNFPFPNSLPQDWAGFLSLAGLQRRDGPGNETGPGSAQVFLA